MAVSLDSEKVLPKALKLLRQRQMQYALYRDYYDGRHRIAFASEKWRNAFGRLFTHFALNLCATVVDAVADRLVVTHFVADLEIPTDPSPDAARALDVELHERLIRAVWNSNRMDYNAGRVHLSALRDGDAYVIVWPDPDKPTRPIIYLQDTQSIRVKYDPERPGHLQWAVKAWREEESGAYRVTLYYADRIERYITRGRADEIPEHPTALLPLDLEGQPWQIVNPYGRVPVFHFANNASVGDYGHSELRDVIPLQDALNKAVLDQLAAMEFVALPQRWATGIEVEYDEKGNPIPPFTPGVDRLWTTSSEAVKFGEFNQADLSQFTRVIDGFRSDIARVTGVPVHYFNPITDPPSGEALKTLEVRLIRKVIDRQIAFGNVWEDVVRFAHVIQGHPPEVIFDAVWKDPAPRSEKEFAETLVLKSQLGVPRRQLLLELGYTPKQIEEMELQREEEGANVASALLGQLERGEMTERGVQGDGVEW